MMESFSLSRLCVQWIVLLLLFDLRLYAQESVGARFSLQDAIGMAVQNNPDLAAASENVQAFKWAAAAASTPFDPTVYLDVRADRSIRATSSIFETDVIGADSRITQNTQQVKAGFKRRFLWGGEYDLSLRQGRLSDSLQEENPTFSGDLSLTVTQPLLRGFGRDIVDIPRRMAEIQYRGAFADFQTQWSEVVSSVCNTYWRLIFAREDLEIQKQRLMSARQLIDINQAKVGLGLLAPIEVLVAEAGMASREEAVVISEAELAAEEEQMRLLLNDPSFLPRPTDTPMTMETTLNEAHLLEQALKRRPEVQKQRLILEQETLSVQQVGHQRLPALDLIATAGPSGLETAYGASLSQMVSGDSYRWDVGLLFSYPLGNRAALSQLEQETAQWKSARRLHEKVVRQVTLEVREGFRRIRTDLTRIGTTRRALDLAQKKLSAADERFSFGLLNSQSLLEFQDDLADARGRALKAVIDYNQSLIYLEKVTGALPDRVDHVEAP
jgi:outer membrane protein TolC